MKLIDEVAERVDIDPAAFRRLCVETVTAWSEYWPIRQPPSGGCVLKLYKDQLAIRRLDPAAFRRLCVETRIPKVKDPKRFSSRLQAAVC